MARIYILNTSEDFPVTRRLIINPKWNLIFKVREAISSIKVLNFEFPVVGKHVED